MNVIGDRMRQRRKELKMSGVALAEKLGVIRNTISRWERGDRKPRMKMLSAIATALDTSTEYLLHDGNDYAENKETSMIEKVVSVPVYKIQETISYDTNQPSASDINMDDEMLLPKHIFSVIDDNRPPLAVIMPNDSMKGANMNEHDRVIVNPAEHVNNGDPALVIYNRTPMLRWVCYKANGNVELQAANPNHSTIVVEAQQTKDPNIITIIGRSVVAITQKDLKSAF